jgi:acetyl esterase/lipase/ubiquinone/menaquinone biosynthesis C-methylase UbiE
MNFPARRNWYLLALCLASCLVLSPPLWSQEKSVFPGINKPYEDPNVKEAVEKFENAQREVSTHRKEIVAACKLKPGMAVADIGAGTGLFTRMFAAEVGPSGKVYAVDIAKNFVEHIEKTCREAGIKNVRGIVCKPDSVELPPNSVDLVFTCDTYHHFEFPQKTLATIHRALRPGGKLILLDYCRIEGKSPDWLMKHLRAGQEVFTKEIEAAGFKVVDTAGFLKENYFVRFEKVDAAATKPERISLWHGQAPVGEGKTQPADAFITVHRPAPDKANGAAAVICPGGGYGVLVTGPEGHGIAQWFNQHGIAGIVLEYRLPRGNCFVPLSDAQRAIRTVRSQAKAWGIDPARIGIIGFSAGGHLASTAATHFDGGDPNASDPIDRVSCRPDFALLVYPVISMGEKTHGGSKANLLGRNPTPEMVERFSNEKQVTERTPPMFLAHAKDDRLVVPENSRTLYDALQARKIASEYLELPSGGHGLNGYKGPMWDAWQTKGLEWLRAQKFIP